MVSKEKELARKLYREYLEEQGEFVTELHSREYKIFKKKVVGKGTFYEKLAKFAGKLVQLKVPPEKKKKVEDIFYSYGLDVTAEEAYAVPFFLLLLIVIFVLPLFFVSSFLSISLLLIGAYFVYYYWAYPDILLNMRRSHASSEMVLAVLYMVIYMRNNSNLEAAVKFASENLEGPLAVDFKKILWDVETKVYNNVMESLNAYVENWKKYNEAFVDAIYLLENSLIQKSEERRISMLDQALKRILDGTYEMMVHYVNGLRTPVSAVFMLGITLPIMGLVMLPLIGAFMANLVNAQTLFVFYDVLLPLVVMIMINQILQNRPSAFPPVNVQNHPLVPPEDHFYLGKKAVHAFWPAFLVFILVSMPYFMYLIRGNPGSPNELDVFFSLFFVLAIAFAVSTYTYFATGIRLKIREDVKEVEKEFSYAVFQIGNRLAEGVPAEIAIVKTAKVMKTSRIRNFVMLLAHNMVNLGMNLERAIFDPEYGVINFYPSALIRSVMKILVQSIKRSQKVAAVSMMNVSSYLLNVHKIEEKVKDVLSETLSTLKFQATFIAPLISGIVVGLTSMILIILSVLNQKVGALETTSASTFGGGLSGSMAFGFFQLSNAIPLSTFQIIVGIYLIEVTIISALLASKIENGDDKINEYATIYKMLTIAIVIYAIVSLVVTIAFAGMAKLAVTLGEFA